MSAADALTCQHVPGFDPGNPQGERNTWRVVVLTAVMMVVEIVTGWWTGSMALLADGWHMSTHVAALGITAVAYRLARHYIHDARFAFGTFKIEVLGGFSSGLILAMVALFMAWESLNRLLQPHSIQYDQALIVAVIGLIVNVASILLLGHAGYSHHHDHDHDHDHDSNLAHGDLNLRAAYLHILADAVTSVLAIVALLGGKLWQWHWLDPLMGLVGAALVSVWCLGLIRATGLILLDREMDHAVVDDVRAAIESDGCSRVSDLHVWRVGRSRFACIVAIVTSDGRSAAEFRDRLRDHIELAHLTVEVHATLDTVCTSTTT